MAWVADRIQTLHRRRLALAAGGSLVVVLAAASVTAAAGGLLSVDPGEGPPGTSYRVTVTCAEAPTLYGRPGNDSGPFPTQVPLSIAQVGPSEWAVDAVAGEVDDVYSVVCGSEVQQERFDTDAPRIYLGPVPLHSFDPIVPRTKVEGTDCPPGTSVTVTITVEGRPTTQTAAVDRYGDWSVDLPAPAGTRQMTVVAACGEVSYPRLTVTTTTQPTSPTAPATQPTTAPTQPQGPAPVVPAGPAAPRSGVSTFTG